VTFVAVGAQVEINGCWALHYRERSLRRGDQVKLIQTP